MELNIPALCGELLFPAVEHITVNISFMNLYCVLKRGESFFFFNYFTFNHVPIDLTIWRL